MGQHIKFKNRLEQAFYKVDRGNKLREQDFKCYYCNTPLTYITVTADHIVPLSKTGRVHSAGNIVAACDDCNNKKDDNDTFELNPFDISINEACERIKERGLQAEYNIKKYVGQNVRGSYKKWKAYKKKRREI